LPGGDRDGRAGLILDRENLLASAAGYHRKMGRAFDKWANLQPETENYALI